MTDDLTARAKAIFERHQAVAADNDQMTSVSWDDLSEPVKDGWRKAVRDAEQRGRMGDGA